MLSNYIAKHSKKQALITLKGSNTIMSKRKIAYVCTDCGSEHSKWQGQCSDCKQWNTLKEFVVSAAKPSARNQALTGYAGAASRSEEHTSELQSRPQLVSRLLLEKK